MEEKKKAETTATITTNGKSFDDTVKEIKATFDAKIAEMQKKLDESEKRHAETVKSILTTGDPTKAPEGKRGFDVDKAAKTIAETLTKKYSKI